MAYVPQKGHLLVTNLGTGKAIESLRRAFTCSPQDEPGEETMKPCGIDSIRWGMCPAGGGPRCLSTVTEEPHRGDRGAVVLRGPSKGSGVYTWYHR